MLGITLIKGDQRIKTFGDWGLIPKTRFKVSPAEPKYNYIEVEGSDAIIDLTESLTGYVCYKMRSCEITFTIAGRRSAWSGLYSTIQNFIQGQHLQVVSDEEPEWCWVGRFQVSDWDTVQKIGEITISGNVEPYKISLQGTNSDWLWDEFNFETDAIRTYEINLSDLTFTEGIERILVHGSKKHVVPVFTVTEYGTGQGSVSLKVSDTDIRPLSAGQNRFPDIVFGEEEKYFYFPYTRDDDYNTVVTVDFEVGSL